MSPVGVVLLIVGVWFFLAPKSAFNVDKKEVRMFKAKLIGTKKTYVYYKYAGLVFVLVGLLLLFKVL